MATSAHAFRILTDGHTLTTAEVEELRFISELSNSRIDQTIEKIRNTDHKDWIIQDQYWKVVISNESVLNDFRRQPWLSKKKLIASYRAVGFITEVETTCDLHFDDMNSVLEVLAGLKIVALAPPCNRVNQLLKSYRGEPSNYYTFDPFDAREEDLVGWHFVAVPARCCIHLPRGWYHAILSLAGTIGVSLKVDFDPQFTGGLGPDLLFRLLCPARDPSDYIVRCQPVPGRHVPAPSSRRSNQDSFRCHCHCGCAKAGGDGYLWALMRIEIVQERLPRSKNHTIEMLRVVQDDVMEGDRKCYLKCDKCMGIHTVRTQEPVTNQMPKEAPAGCFWRKVTARGEYLYRRSQFTPLENTKNTMWWKPDNNQIS